MSGGMNLLVGEVAVLDLQLLEVLVRVVLCRREVCIHEVVRHSLVDSPDARDLIGQVAGPDVGNLVALLQVDRLLRGVE